MKESLVLASACISTGAAILGYTWWCWSGRTRRWLRSRRGTWLVLGPLPAFGLGFVGVGASILDGGGPLSQALIATAVAGNLLGLLAGMLEPSWWGPPWLNDLRASGVDIHADEDDETAGSDTRTYTLRSPPFGAASDRMHRLMRHVTMGARAREEWPTTKVDRPDRSGENGSLRRYKDGLVFVVDEPSRLPDGSVSKDVVAMPFPEIRDVGVVYRAQGIPDGADEPEETEFETPLLLVSLKDGYGWMFDVPRVASTARRIGELAGCPVQEIR